MSKKSTYFFIGRLSDHSAKYNVQEFPLNKGFFLEVLLDGISIWGSTGRPFDKLSKEIREIFTIIIAAFVFKTNAPLTYTLENWIEAKETIAKKNMIGWFLNPFASREHYPRRSKKNTAWKKSAWLYNNLSKGNNNHILALKDYHSAVMDISDDAFLFAYRSIEDICRAVTGCDNVENKYWQQMHQTLDTSKSFIDPLTRVAEKVRHGNKSHRLVSRARAHREKLLNIAHEVIKKELKRTFPRFF